MLIHRIIDAILLVPVAILSCLALILTVDKAFDELHKRVPRLRDAARPKPMLKPGAPTRAPMAAVGADEPDRA